MDESTKKLFYKGLGIALLLKDNFSKEFEEILKEAQLSKNEIEKEIDEAKNIANKEKEFFEKLLKEKIKSVINELNLATKEDIQELKELLEQKAKKPI